MFVWPTWFYLLRKISRLVSHRYKEIKLLTVIKFGLLSWGKWLHFGHVIFFLFKKKLPNLKSSNGRTYTPNQHLTKCYSIKHWHRAVWQGFRETLQSQILWQWVFVGFLYLSCPWTWKGPGRGTWLSLSGCPPMLAPFQVSPWAGDLRWQTAAFPAPLELASPKTSPLPAPPNPS